MDNLNISKLLKIKDRITIDIVGDSVTWGLNHCNENETYAAYFARMIAAKYPSVSVYRYDGITHNERKPMEKFSEPIPVSKVNCGNFSKRRIGGHNNFYVRNKRCLKVR